MSKINISTPSMMWTEWFFLCIIVFLFWDDPNVEIDNWDKFNAIIESHYQQSQPTKEDKWIGND